MPKKRTAENEMIVPAASAAAPARRKTAPRTRPKHSVEAVESTSNSISNSISEPVVAAEETLEVGVVTTPTREAIARLAYSFWEARGYQGGSPDEDWKRAEQQLRKKAPVVD